MPLSASVLIDGLTALPSSTVDRFRLASAEFLWAFEKEGNVVENSCSKEHFERNYLYGERLQNRVDASHL